MKYQPEVHLFFVAASYVWSKGLGRYHTPMDDFMYYSRWRLMF